MVHLAPRPERDSLDDSWFDRPARPLPREAPRPAKPKGPDAGRDDSIELDNPWFHGDDWR